MADISKINIGGTDYNIKDAVARAASTGGMHFIGVTSTKIADQSTTTTLTAATQGSLNKTTGFVAGDLVIYDNKEFVWTGELWSEFGSTGSLKGLAFKDNASGTITGVPTSTHTHSIGSLSHSVTQGTVSASGNYTPAGTVTISNNDKITSLTESENGGFKDTTNPKQIGAGDKILTNYETTKVTITPVGGTTDVYSITGVGTLPTLGTKFTIPNVTGVGSLPTYETKEIPNVTNAGTMFEATVNGETLTLTAGSVPTISNMKISVNSITGVGTLPTLGTSFSVPNVTGVGTLPTRSSKLTVATAGTDKTFKAVDVEDWGNNPLNDYPTIARAINASFSGNPAVIGVSGSTSGVAVAAHTAGTTGAPSATEGKTVTVS